MNKATSALGAGIAGAGLMYMLDPEFGGHRRALLGDRCSRFARVLSRGADIAARNVGFEGRGQWGQEQHTFGSGRAADLNLIDLVRAEMGRAVSNPSSVKVTVRNGLVTLSGAVFQHEHKPLLKRIRRLAGVRLIDDRLGRHEWRQGVMGGIRPMGRRPGQWTPAARAFAITTGVGAVLFGLNRRDTPSRLLAGAGAALLTRAIVNKSTKRHPGLGEREAA